MNKIAHSDPLVHVITPLYNTEKYLGECIRSVLSQTYQRWEYTIVNNCSSDRSLEIANQYAAQDSRIHVHENERYLDMMENWNHSMRQLLPESRYCKVVHADDRLFPDCLEKMVAVAEDNPSVGIVGAYRLDENVVDLDGLPEIQTCYPGSDICRWQLLGGNYIFGSPTSLLYRSDRVRSRDPFFNEANIHADQEVCFDILSDSDFGFVHQILTYTRRHNESNTTFTRKFSTYRLGHLKCLIEYGPRHLGQTEYQRRLDSRLRSYHRFLARSIIGMKGRAFREYHCRGLRQLGLRIQKLSLLRALLIQLLDLATSLRILRHGLRRRNRRVAKS